MSHRNCKCICSKEGNLERIFLYRKFSAIIKNIAMRAAQMFTFTYASKWTRGKLRERITSNRINNTRPAFLLHVLLTVLVKRYKRIAENTRDREWMKRLRCFGTECECAPNISMYVVANETGRYDRFVCAMTLSVAIFQSNETGRIEQHTTRAGIFNLSRVNCASTSSCGNEIEMKTRIESNRMFGKNSE